MSTTMAIAITTIIPIRGTCVPIYLGPAHKEAAAQVRNRIRVFGRSVREVKEFVSLTQTTWVFLREEQCRCKTRDWRDNGRG